MKRSRYGNGSGLALGVLTLMAVVAAGGAAAPVVVDPAVGAILLPAAPVAALREAAGELQSHLKLITGADIAVHEGGAPAGVAYTFRVGSPAPGDAAPLAPEEARWVVTPAATYLYGDSARGNGVLSAVYAFLEDQLGVRWLWPGASGLAAPKLAALALTPGEYSWSPVLELRKIRVYARPGRDYPQLKDYVAEFAAFLPSREEHDTAANDVRQWQLRQRMGGHSEVQYGHAFTGWWDRYGTTHPEYFALNKWGKREPERREAPGAVAAPVYSARDRESVKLCASNPKVAEQIVQDWLAAGRRSRWINVCENDQVWGFCRCPDCLALDGRTPGEPLPEYLTGLTDRYVHLANAVARLARQHDPAAAVVMYAYEAFEAPPRRQALDPNVLVAIVPTTVDVPDLVRLFGDWKRAGATRLLMRPNYPCYYNTLALPLGAEKQMYDAFQVAYEFGVIATDYDSLTGLWPYCGLSDYVLAKAFSDPAKPFAYWEEHYCAAFGAAAADVRAYFRYWRKELWDKRLLPDLAALVANGKSHNFARGLIWSLGDYYRLSDFDATDAILARAAATPGLDESQRAKIRVLALANRNARLTFLAVTTPGLAKFEHSRALLDFRAELRHEPPFAPTWLGVFSTESRYGDATGTKIAVRLNDYPMPWIETALAWQFRLDPTDTGLKENWQEKPWDELLKWDRLRTDFFWDNPYDSETDPALMAKLKDYDGVGWYAMRLAVPPEFKGRTIILYFGAVDESCWVYVNGKPAGEHVFKDSKDWCTPFEIRIDPVVDWQQPFQVITVRVEDKAGSGGIWKRVWLVSKDK